MNGEGAVAADEGNRVPSMLSLELKASEIARKSATVDVEEADEDEDRDVGVLFIVIFKTAVPPSRASEGSKMCKTPAPCLTTGELAVARDAPVEVRPGMS